MAYSMATLEKMLTHKGRNVYLEKLNSSELTNLLLVVSNRTSCGRQIKPGTANGTELYVNNINNGEIICPPHSPILLRHEDVHEVLTFYQNMYSTSTSASTSSTKSFPPSPGSNVAYYVAHQS